MLRLSSQRPPLWGGSGGMRYSCCPRGQLTAVCKTVHNIIKVKITRNITEFSYTFVHKMPWLENFLQTLYVHCFRFILLIVTCYFTTMLVDFLNIKHFSPSEDVKCVSTAALWSRDSFVILIFEPLLLFHMRQFLSQTPSFRFRQCASLQNHQPPGGRSWHRHYVAQHQGGGGQGGHRINYSELR